MRGFGAVGCAVLTFFMFFVSEPHDFAFVLDPEFIFSVQTIQTSYSFCPKSPYYPLKPNSSQNFMVRNEISFFEPNPSVNSHGLNRGFFSLDQKPHILSQNPTQAFSHILSQTHTSVLAHPIATPTQAFSHISSQTPTQAFSHISSQSHTQAFSHISSQSPHKRSRTSHRKATHKRSRTSHHKAPTSVLAPSKNRPREQRLWGGQYSLLHYLFGFCCL